MRILAGKPLLLVTALLPIVAGALLTIVASALSPQRRVWTTSSFLDFSDGTLVDGGANSYVAADGSLRLINLWDLNNDGNLDLLLANTHDNDEVVDLSIFWGKQGFSPNRRTQLPSNGGKAVAIADLNGDGYPDLIVANQFDGTTTQLNSYVYWGSGQGFDAGHRIELPTQGAEAVAVADLNGDGSPEIVFANSGLTYHMAEDRYRQSYIYWGNKGAYSAERRSTIPTLNSRDVKIADLNKDGWPDLVFANAGNGPDDGGVFVYWGGPGGKYSDERVSRLPGIGSSSVALADLNGDGYLDILLANSFRLRDREMGIYSMIETVALNSYIYWGSAQGYAAGRRTELPTVRASGVDAGDLNGDGRPDVVFANGTGRESYIYWNGPDGFRPYRRTSIPSSNAAACLVRDLNRDGHPDLVFANFSEGRSHAAKSYLYWGGPDGVSPARRTELPTLGATGIGVADLNGDNELDLVFMNREGGSAGEQVSSWIYWGDARGQFASDRRLALPVTGPNGYSAADLNRDGYVDLFFPGNQSIIYWGAKSGYSTENRFVLANRPSYAARVADVNRDGFLDLVVNEWSPGNRESSLYYGGLGGFSAANRFVFRMDSARIPAVADLNKDGWPDVIYPTNAGQVILFWNGPNGFDNARKDVLPCGAAGVVEIADLNKDGYLDIIVPNQWTRSRPHPFPIFGGSPEAGTYIYWGSAGGYSESHRLELPTTGAKDVAVADLNNDGYLDLVVSSYHAGNTRNHPPYIFWNGPDGFDAKRATLLETYSAAGILIADFNRDGYQDIFFANHTKNGKHLNDSFLYWGGPQGHSSERRSLVPGLGPHFLASADVGNIYDRGDRYDYVSPPFDGGLGAGYESIRWEGETPYRTAIEFQVRLAGTRDALAAAKWLGPEGPNSFYRTSGSKLAGWPRDGRWIQYKASLISPELANTPILRSVSIEYVSGKR